MNDYKTFFNYMMTGEHPLLIKNQKPRKKEKFNHHKNQKSIYKYLVKCQKSKLKQDSTTTALQQDYSPQQAVSNTK